MKHQTVCKSKKNYGFCSRSSFTLMFYSYITLFFFARNWWYLKKTFYDIYAYLVSLWPRNTKRFRNPINTAAFGNCSCASQPFGRMYQLCQFFSDFLMFGCSWISMMRAIAYTTQQSNNILIILKFDNNFEINVIKIICFMPHMLSQCRCDHETPNGL